MDEHALVLHASDDENLFSSEASPTTIPESSRSGSFHRGSDRDRNRSPAQQRPEQQHGFSMDPGPSSSRRSRDSTATGGDLDGQPVPLLPI